MLVSLAIVLVAELGIVLLDGIDLGRVLLAPLALLGLLGILGVLDLLGLLRLGILVIHLPRNSTPRAPLWTLR